MARSNVLFLLPGLISLLLSTSPMAQSWKLVKEKDGIAVFTRDEPNTNLKSFKGVAEFKTTMKKLCACLGNLDNLDWWDEDIKEINILQHERDKFIHY